MSAKEVSGYLAGLGLHPVQDLEEELLAVFGGEEGRRLVVRFSQLFDEMDARLLSNRGRDPAILRQDAMVELIHSDPRLVVIFASFYDRAVLRRLLCFLEDCLPYLGESILDMGAGNGIVAGYLSRLKPSAAVAGAELSENARRRAAELCGSASGVTFTAPERAGIFDTVISLRTWHENMILLPESATGRLSREELIRRYAASAADYAGLLASHVKPGGHLITAERFVDPAHYGGILAALKAAGFTQLGSEDEKLTKDIQCMVGDAFTRLRTGVFQYRQQKQETG